MPTPSERRALLFVAAVAALGLGVRGCRALAPAAVDAAPRAALAAQIAAVDSAVTSGGRPRARRPPRESSAQAATAPASAGPAAPVDMDRASAAELDALPGIGPALAQRIIEDRAANGAFGSLEALQDVRGIGPTLAAKLAPLVTFSAPPRQPLSAERKRASSHP